MNPAPSLTSRSLYAVTHPGLVHHTNEDSWAVLDTADGGLLLVVCDGMGGMGHGDEASQLAVRSLISELGEGAADPAASLLAALTRIDCTVRDALCNGGKGLPGTTAVLAWIREGWAQIGWVGDSRAYWIRDGVVVERTRDHKLVEELLAAGQLTEAEARNSMLSHVVTRAIGGRAPDEPAVEGSLSGPWALAPGDRVVLISDGVCDLVTDDEIAAAVSGAAPSEGGDRLVKMALDRGGHDNITAIVLVAEPHVPPPEAPAKGPSVRGTSVPRSAASEPAPTPPPPLPSARETESPEEDFVRSNRNYTTIIVGALATVALTAAVVGWLLLG